ncbi:hypothetical protein LR48_Vigan03g068200 [Vigna angularis]|uniref:Uncharacterized protein n=1 Tax=Phaseolus angularis TaxID=3914 RepID=A0A0L9U3E6_PHAAN|nr:hypothetical protein LR48_Vigan03g068200 [Vigna angularis]
MINYRIYDFEGGCIRYIGECAFSRCSSLNRTARERLRSDRAVPCEVEWSNALVHEAVEGRAVEYLRPWKAEHLDRSLLYDHSVFGANRLVAFSFDRSVTFLIEGEGTCKRHSDAQVRSGLMSFCS